MSYNYLPPITSAQITGTSPTYTVTPGAAFRAGNYTITNGTGATAWTTVTADPDLHGKTLHVQGDANITGDLTIKGKSINDRLDLIEKRLAILHPNKKLEQKWERLKALGDMYRELEAEIIEKEQIWAKLKK